MSGFTIMMFVLLVLGVVILAPSLKLLIEQHQQISSLERAVQNQKNRVTDLKGQVARWSDPAYIEAQARNRLLFVFPGEYPFLVTDSETTTATADGAPISKSLQNTQVDWVKTLTSSVLTAGLSQAPASTINSPIQSPVTGGTGSTSGSTAGN
jgi:cell division protein FtsB